MEMLITTYKRNDLLQKTVDSFFHKQKYEDIELTIQEDSSPCDFKFNTDNLNTKNPIKIILLGKKCTNKNIEYYLNKLASKYYFHCEDDWEFNNKYDFIQASIDIMEKEPDVCKVLCRSTNNPHRLYDIRDVNGIRYADMYPFEGHVTWHGFSWTPGLTRVEALKKCTPFNTEKGAYGEVKIMQDLHSLGYKTVHLVDGVCKHIGIQSTWSS